MTRDAGKHWHTLTATLAVSGQLGDLVSGLVDLDFVNTHDGYLFNSNDRCTSRCVLVTRDAGRTWSATHLPAVQQILNGDGVVYALTALARHGRQEVLRNRVGRSGWTVLRTDVGTDNHRAYLAATGETIALLRAGSGIAPTHRLGSLELSYDEGDTWVRRPMPCRPADGGAAVVSVALDHPYALLIDCYNGRQSSEEQQTAQHLYGPADWGRSWVRLSDPAETGAPTDLVDNGKEHAFLVTYSGAVGFQLRVSTDAAATWHTKLRGGRGGYGMGDLRFLSPSVGFALGPTHYAPEQLYRTIDGGATWHRLPVPH